MTDSDKISMYLDRLINDEDVRGRLSKSASSGKSALRRARGKGGVKKVASDAKVRRKAANALTAAQEAIDALTEPEKKPKKRWLKRLFVLALLSGGLYLALNAQARERLLGLAGLHPDDPINSAGPTNLESRDTPET